LNMQLFEICLLRQIPLLDSRKKCRLNDASCTVTRMRHH
jgi:hypothetical protein